MEIFIKRSNLSEDVKEELSKTFKEVKKYFKDNNFSTSALAKFFAAFIEQNNFDNILEKCLILRKRGVKLEKWLILYGEDQGKKKWAEYCERQSFTNSQEYKKMTDEEFKKYNKSRSITLENMKIKYGEEEGTKRFFEYCEKQAYTNSLEYFISKYGKQEGKEKWLHINFLKGRTLESYYSKYDDKDLAFEEYNKSMLTQKGFYSKMSEELFSELDRRLEYKFDLRYEPKTKEFGKYNFELMQYTFFDCVIPNLKLCIEFNGDYFHANPRKFKSTDTPNPYCKELTSEMIWARDKVKNDNLINQGFDIIVVWEMDYKNDSNSIIEQLEEIIKDRNEYYR